MLIFLNTNVTLLHKGNMETQIQKQSDVNEMFKLYTDVIAPGQDITTNEFKVYLDYCNKRGFDPLAKDIYVVKRKDYKTGQVHMSFQSSIDAIRKRGVANPDYEGQVGPFWCGEDGLWRDVWLLKTPPKAARVGIWRKNFREPVFAVALFDEYAQKTKEGRLTRFWADMPTNQLAKCAESLAWRKSYPDSFAGLYTAEEMDQADNDQHKEITKEVKAVNVERAKTMEEMVTKFVPTPDLIGYDVDSKWQKIFKIIPGKILTAAILKDLGFIHGKTGLAMYAPYNDECEKMLRDLYNTHYKKPVLKAEVLEEQDISQDVNSSTEVIKQDLVAKLEQAKEEGKGVL